MSIRQEKLAGMIQAEISQIFIKNNKDWFPGFFPSITEVQATKDLSIATIYVTTLNKPIDQLLVLVEEHNWEIRRQLASSIKNSVRKIPELRFLKDDTAEKLERINQLLKNINKK